MGYDVVIIGAGSAGCVLADRLSADPAARILLLEAGGPDKQTEIGIPAAFSKLFKTAVDWDYSTEPQPELAGRRLFWPRGKMLGGCSSMNAMIYIRGHRLDYDGWAENGCPGWSYEEVLPYFRRSESLESEGVEGGRFHGADGPLTVTDLRSPSPLSRAFVDAAIAAGLRRNRDFNGAEQTGCGLYHVTQRRGRRLSAAGAFLVPALGRPNLEVRTGTLAVRVLFEGLRAVGVETLCDGVRETVEAGRIVVAAGAVNSPQLLLLSGVGPAADLEALDVPVVRHLPGVGENLHDHLVLILGYQCRRPVSLARAETLGALARFLLLRRGPLTSNVGEAGGFTHALAPESEAPDLQFHFAPAYFRNHGFDNPPGHGFSIGPTLVRPRSRGRLSLRSADPLAAPVLDPRYLTASEDLELLVAGVERAREIIRQAPFDDFRGAEVIPESGSGKEALRAFARAQAETLYHPVGTCRMGSDEMAVVDPGLGVRGIDNLWVADASVMPTIVNGNTNAATIMIGERAAELVSGS